MGTTLENGVYLPSEGERNCYAGLKTNWEILDQKVADVTALQQAVAGALHRQIVASLPTTDIDPNTIYMILSGTSATENVYNEFMYVNNAWELIGTSATDLTNYYTKAEVDGKLLLKASASDLTSHTGDTTIHVTTADKNKWNNQTYVFRYSSTALTPSSTNSNTLLDNTDNLKVGDKVIDSSGVLFSITAIDTQNSTFTIGTALIDLAQDSDVVHKSGDETIGGVKAFANNRMVVGRNTDNVSVVQFVNSDVVGDSANGTSGFEVYGSSVSDANKIGGVTVGEYSNNGGSYALIECNRTASGVKSSNVIRSLIRSDGTKELTTTVDNDCRLGSPFLRWSKIYGTEYYYGSNNVEFSTKFVTTDTAQTISGAKTFSDNISTKKIISNVAQLQINARSNADSVAVIAGADASEGGGIWLYGKNSVNNSHIALQVYDTNNSTYHAMRLNMDGAVTPTVSNNGLGNRTFKWKSFNGVEPSSLSLPATTGTIDISSYITDLTGVYVNTYTPPANGYIVITCNSNDVDYIKVSNNLNFVSVVDNTNNQFTSGILGVWQPCVTGVGIQIRIKASALNSAKFIPCQGNV